MTYLVVLQAVIIIAIAWVCYLLLADSRKQKRASERREDALLNRLAHANGKPWVPPPAEPATEDVPAASYSPLPEQDPDQE